MICRRKKQEIKNSNQLILSGQIILLDEDISINRSLKKEQVVHSDLYRKYLHSTQDMFNGCYWMFFNPVVVFQKNMRISMCFKEENIFEVSMSIVSNDLPNSWDDWTEAGELERKSKHDALLSELFQNKPDKVEGKPYPLICYNFHWGEVYSIFDNKSGWSSIGIKYKSNDKI